MIWTRTPAGQAELKTHAAGLRAAAQNVLMVLDGMKTEEMLLANLVGVTRDDFRTLAHLGLIAPAAPAAAVASTVGGNAQTASTRASAATRVDGQFAAVLANVITTHLGLAGFRLLAACEKATTTAELHDLARIAIGLIQERKGSTAAEDARGRLAAQSRNSAPGS